MIKDYLSLARPRQWPKNGLLFAALIFSGKFATDTSSLAKAVTAFAAFILLSSAVYAFNDAGDAKADKGHPVKKQRPVASGRIRVGQALAFSGALALLGLGLSAAVNVPVLVCGAGYLVLSAAYSLGLKHEAILDVFLLSAGFVIRAVAGGLAIGVPISPWLLSCTTLLALFMGLSKRRAELTLLGKARAKAHRKSLLGYNEALLDQMISVVASATVVAYSLYAFSARSFHSGPWMMLTVPFVLYGIFRYLALSHLQGMAGQPEQVLLSDRPTQINLGLWILTAGLILALAR